MGNLFTSCCKKTRQNRRFSTKISQPTNLQILVAGDSKVGKSTLINNYVSDSPDVTFANHSEMIRIVNAQQIISDPNNADKTLNVHVSIIEVEGSSNETNKQLRECYYATSQIVLVLYNIQSVESLYNVRKTWQAEIDETVNKTEFERNKSVLDDSIFRDIQLVLVGVNPEARDNQVEVVNEFVEVDDFEEEDGEFDTVRLKVSAHKALQRKMSQNDQISAKKGFKKWRP